MNQPRPLRIPQSRWASADSTEMTSGVAAVWSLALRYVNQGMVDPEVILPFYIQRVVVPAQVHCITTCTSRFAAGRALVKVKWIMMNTVHAEP